MLLNGASASGVGGKTKRQLRDVHGLEMHRDESDVVGVLRELELLDDAVGELVDRRGRVFDELDEARDADVDRLPAALDEPVRVQHDRGAGLDPQVGFRVRRVRTCTNRRRAPLVEETNRAVGARSRGGGWPALASRSRERDGVSSPNTTVAKIVVAAFQGRACSAGSGSRPARSPRSHRRATRCGAGPSSPLPARRDRRRLRRPARSSRRRARRRHTSRLRRQLRRCRGRSGRRPPRPRSPAGAPAEGFVAGSRRCGALARVPARDRSRPRRGPRRAEAEARPRGRTRVGSASPRGRPRSCVRR